MYVYWTRNSQTHFWSQTDFSIYIMVVWVVEFSSGGYKIRKFCLKINLPKANYWILRIRVVGRCQKVPKFNFQSQFFSSKINGSVSPAWKLDNLYYYNFDYTSFHQKGDEQVSTVISIFAVHLYTEHLSTKEGSQNVEIGILHTVVVWVTWIIVQGALMVVHYVGTVATSACSAAHFL